MKHTHKWAKTGNVHYTCPLQYEEKCKCGKIRLKTDKNSGIETINLTREEQLKRHPELFGKI